METILIIFGVMLTICGSFLMIRSKLNYHLVRKGMDLDYYWKNQVESYQPQAEQIAQKEQSDLWSGLGITISGSILGIVSYFS